MIERKSDYPKNRDDISFSHIIKIALIFAAIAIPLYIFLDKLSDKQNKNHAISVLVSECSKKCRDYGISYKNLLGPTQEYGYGGRTTLHYSFVWSSNNSPLIVRIKFDKFSGDDPVHTTVEWILPK